MTCPFDGGVICRLLRCGKPVVAAAYSQRRMDIEVLAQAARNPELALADITALAFSYTLQPELESGSHQVRVIDGMCRVKQVAMGCAAIQRDAFETLIAAGMAPLQSDNSLARLGLESPLYDFFNEITLEDGPPPIGRLLVLQTLAHCARE